MSEGFRDVSEQNFPAGKDRELAQYERDVSATEMIVQALSDKWNAHGSGKYGSGSPGEPGQIGA